MIYSQQIIVKRWIPILKEYEKCKAKVTPRSFKFVKDLGILNDYSRPHVPQDLAVLERLFRTTKQEEVYRNEYLNHLPGIAYQTSLTIITTASLIRASAMLLLMISLQAVM